VRSKSNTNTRRREPNNRSHNASCNRAASSAVTTNRSSPCIIANRARPSPPTTGTTAARESFGVDDAADDVDAAVDDVVADVDEIDDFCGVDDVAFVDVVVTSAPHSTHSPPHTVGCVQSDIVFFKLFNFDFGF
jgi:hypothetical protein